ncbi:flagellar biosynthesis protein FlhA [Novosphingobium sp.]|uniref:flagellar biosynthesis protein FlhA n=1 Tax=Novosphingobium sp. TaxID=1874826 RepID=UPI0022C07C70|nr:flagellar biosynthesis protein FlhA [Novosphingobium sp.]MCZ8018077.1 flagellar biosynthesis protein FlhA [Novosphingobium sp.]MCZ8034396.1 flagellar biosynthesis protein FlhA [Novosphingobium sp.]MCZ8052364.1 flagellar biosynthesis protein FlhA [Novosphingobium sp.]MCZ8061229.1 flagellar biosynthesis protein FlhA [Novosphingobium sp.]MCZ8232860.1 flagellar biosynthesis protein FlhA [Novosphingobium sp.]
MVVPVPALLLDVFFVLNIALSVAVLMAAMNAAKPLDFSSFPSVLLFATLLRLALNVASTRVVLVHGHEGEAAAGHVIEAFGAFLVGGNFAVGLFVFLILVIINMVVITKGAGRVSEVSARFTLDALPGKQMAIDADLAAGILTADEAKARRKEVATEADFYGAMDGSSKFVKGDAIAALLILAVNIIAGFALGMISHGMSAGEAAKVYITLAVGDALVAQVPALLLSIAAAVIVTRVADDRDGQGSDLSGQIGGQLAEPRTWLPVALILAAIGLIPAMPQTIFLPAAVAALALWRALSRRAALAGRPVPVVEAPADPGRIALGEVSDHTLVTIELGYGLVQLVDEGRGAPLVGRITGVRKQLSQAFGFVVPQFRVRDSLDLAPQDYRILLGGVPLGGGSIRPDRILAIDVGDVREGYTLAGEETRDPSFGCPARWIVPVQRDLAIAEGFLTVDASTVIATQLNQLLGARPGELLGPDQVRAIIDAIKEYNAGLVEAIHPQPLSLAALTRVLRALLDDGIPIGHPLPILSSLADAVQVAPDHERLVDLVRADLGGLIVGRICAPGERLPVLTLDAQLEGAIVQGLTDPATGQPMVEPDLARNIGDHVAALVADRGANAAPLALVVQPRARRPLAGLLKLRAPSVLVLSIAELPASQPIEVVAVIGAPPALSDHVEVLAA